MKYGVILIAATSLSISGCTTVNLQNMAGKTAVDASVEQADRNVVQRAVDSLRAAFASRGFGEKSSQKKMQAAANMLLNGLSARSVSTSSDDYASAEKTRDVILDDMALAKRHVDQTQRAAQVYLEVAPLDRDMTEELASLEEALMASEKAVKTFKLALAVQTSPELDGLKSSIEGLRLVTDQFGDRVRQKKANKSNSDQMESAS